MNNILYVTSFNEKLYESTGRNMVQSFLNCGIDGDLLICYEDDLLSYKNDELTDLLENYTLDRTHPRCHVYDLDQDIWLKSWTERNKDIIPPEYGGTCEVWGDLVKHKWGTNFNRQAARWFRKVVSLKCASYQIDLNFGNNYDAIILCDCDTIFTKYLPSNLVFKIFGNYEVFYHLGPNRRARQTGIEAGFMGFKKVNGKFRFLDILFEIYDSGKFKEYERWDDGYIYRMIVDEHPELLCIDIVKPHLEQYGAHVIPHGPFNEYIVHLKGHHQRQGLIVKNEDI